MSFREVLTHIVEWVKDDVSVAGDSTGPLVAVDMLYVERLIREDFDHFDDVYLRGKGNLLMRQRTGRLCEEVVRHVLHDRK